MTKALDVNHTGPITAGARLVLVTLADYANDESQAWPAVQRIAGRLGMSKRNVQNHLRDLEQLGLLEHGDQELVSHYRADRRPLVWHLVYVDGPVHEVKQDAPRDEVKQDAPREATGCSAVPERGEAGFTQTKDLTPQDPPNPPPLPPPVAVPVDGGPLFAIACAACGRTDKPIVTPAGECSRCLARSVAPNLRDDTAADTPRGSAP